MLIEKSFNEKGENNNVYYMFGNKENKSPKLKKDGTPKIIVKNKKKGVKSEVYAFNPDDIFAILSYYEKNEKWIHYLLFVLSLNLARRVGDTLTFTWKNFYNPQNGRFRKEILEIVEDKTDKLANPYINSACRKAIDLYIEKTGCNPAENNYTNPIFLQLSGNFKGRILTYGSALKNLKKAAISVGIMYNVGMHSLRKTFGVITRQLHPDDIDSMQLLQTIYNHHDLTTTNRYIGLTKEKVNSYYEDIGNFFENYVSDNERDIQNKKEYIEVKANIGDLKDLIYYAYETGWDDGEKNEKNQKEAIDDILHMLDNIVKYPESK